MDNQMFCFQCEQTAGCAGCTMASGVCGKTAETANLQDALTGELIALAQAADGRALTADTHKIMLEGLFTTVTNVNFNPETIRFQIRTVREEALRLSPSASAYDMRNLWQAQEDIRSLKSLILFGLRGMAAYAFHAETLGYSDSRVNAFSAKGSLPSERIWGWKSFSPLS